MIKKITLSCVSILSLCAALFTFASASSEDGCCSPRSSCLDDIRFEVGYATGKFIGIDKDYLELGVFAPFQATCDSYVFTDLRAYRFDESEWATSMGLGFRKGFCDMVLGGNVYWDYREGHCNTDFNRIGIGVEYLSDCFDVRINGYIPVSAQTGWCRKHYYNDYEGGYSATCRRKEFCVAAGFDAEIGTPFFCWCDLSLYGAVGPYYFDKKNEENYWGGMARLELNWKSLLSLEVRTSYDRHNHSHTQGRFLVSIPLDFFNFCNCDDRCCWDRLFTQPVERNGIIFLDHCCNYTWNW